jgi:hypothetical protein
MSVRVRPFGICDYSGIKVRNDKMKVMWNGLKVRPELYDQKPKILDLKSPPPEKIYVDNPRPQQPAVYATTTPEDILRQLVLYGNN